MSVQSLVCCNQVIQSGELWILKDFKGFTARKLYIGKCKICGDDACLQVMTSTTNGNTYYNLYNGIEAVKTIYREKKRKLTVFLDIKSAELFGWIYGINVEIKKNKNVTQVRQYSADFNGNKSLIKKVSL